MSNPIYTFTTHVPQSAQFISTTQRPIESNFQAINEWINVNHVGFSDADNYGKHTFLSFPSQNVNPSTTSTEMAIFCAPSTGANPYELYYRYPSNGSIVQLSGSGSGSSTSGGAASNGYGYLTTTIFIKWGNATGIIQGSNTIVFPTGGGIPAFSETPYQIYYTPSQGPGNYNQQAYISSSSSTQFTLQLPESGAFTSFYWMALGI